MGLAANLISHPIITCMCPFLFLSAGVDTGAKCSGKESDHFVEFF